MCKNHSTAAIAPAPHFVQSGALAILLAEEIEIRFVLVPNYLSASEATDRNDHFAMIVISTA